jgi:DNA-directed RNA polymerase subunit N
MFPCRCYTCNTLLVHLHDQYQNDTFVNGLTPLAAMERAGVERMCCRRMFFSFVDLTEEQMMHPNIDVTLDKGGSVLRRTSRKARIISCD